MLERRGASLGRWMLSGKTFMNTMDRKRKGSSCDLCIVGGENMKCFICGKVPSSVYPRNATLIMMRQMAKDDVKGQRLESLAIRSML
jgi:hypothetical protein